MSANRNGSSRPRVEHNGGHVRKEFEPRQRCRGRGAGMMTLSDSLLELVKKGLVEPEEAYANAVNKQELRSMLERAGVKLATA